MCKVTVKLTISGVHHHLRRLPDADGCVSFKLTKANGRSEVVSFSAESGEPTCTCRHGCNAFGACRHAKAIRFAKDNFDGMPLEARFKLFSGNVSLSQWAEAMEERQREFAEIAASREELVAA